MKWAEYALEGIKANDFWISRSKESSQAQIKARFDSILNKTNPPMPGLSS